MSNNHGNTPAAWTSVGVSMIGFLVGSIALMISPWSPVLFWIGAVLAVGALPLFWILAKMGLHE